MRTSLPLILTTLCLVLYQANLQTQTMLYWSDTEIGKIYKAGLDGSGVEAVVSQNFAAYHVLDFANDRIYWTDTGTKSVHSINFDGSDEKILISGLTDPQGIDMTAADEIILVDHKKISRYTAEGNFIADVVTGLDNPTDLVVHDGMVYWGDQGTSSISRAPVAGTAPQPLIADVFVMVDIEVNPLTDELYWTQTTGIPTGSGIFKANINGSGRTTVLEDFVYGVAIDADSETIYWSSAATHTIHRANINNVADDDTLVSEFLLSPKTLALDTDGGTIFFINEQYDEFLFSADLATGLGVSVLASSDVYRPARFELDTLNDHLYWVNAAGPVNGDEAAAIMRSRLDGSNIEKLVSYPQVEKPFGLALDIDAGKMYWTDMSKRAVRSANLNGTGISNVVATDLLQPRGLLIDKSNNNIYWTDATEGKIQRSNLDGSNIVDLLNTGLESPYEVFLVDDPLVLYFCDYGAGIIGKYDFMTEGFEPIFTTPEPEFNRPNSLYVDKAGGSIYFTVDHDDVMLMRIDLDGSNPEELAVPDINSPHDIYVLRMMTSGLLHPGSSEPVHSTVYPNPFHGNLNIESQRPLERMDILNSIGFKVHSVEVAGSVNHTLQYNGLTPGVYWVVLHIEGSRPELHRVVYAGR